MNHLLELPDHLCICIRISGHLSIVPDGGENHINSYVVKQLKYTSGNEVCDDQFIDLPDIQDPFSFNPKCFILKVEEQPVKEKGVLFGLKDCEMVDIFQKSFYIFNDCLIRVGAYYDLTDIFQGHRVEEMKADPMTVRGGREGMKRSWMRKCNQLYRWYQVGKKMPASSLYLPESLR